MKFTRILKQQNLKQQTIAQQLNVSQQCISRWCCGKSIPNIHNMQKLAIALDVDLKTILECFYGGPNEIEI